MKTFPKELIEEAKRLLDEIKHPCELSDAIDDLLESHGYDLDDVVDLMNCITPAIHA